MGTSDTAYQLGSAPREQERLTLQGRVLAPATRTIFEAAGIRSGMRVLDLGSGMGDVAFVAAELVGSAGSVVGIDRSTEAVTNANLRAQQQGSSNVRFVVGDIHETAPDGPYDAIIGRLVLMYVPDPAAVLKTQAALLRSGGIVVPTNSICIALVRFLRRLSSQALSWLGEAFRRGRIEPALGPRMWAILQQAGLRPMGMLGIQPYFGPDDPDGPAILAGIVQTALPLIERTGVAAAVEVEPDTLQQRLGRELASAAAVFAHPTLLSAWAVAESAR
jgi:SAM-dependent methyltransferase